MPENQAGDWATFKAWLEFYVDAPGKLAEFQSPKFKAIAVAPPNSVLPAAPHEQRVISMDDPIALQQVYERRLKAIR